jgi:hypothetical protein
LQARLATADSRAFVQDLLAGLVIGGHVHLTKVARAIRPGIACNHGVEKRFSGHLGGEAWDMSPVGNRRLLWLVACHFFWLNLWGEERYAHLRAALLNHPWRLPKEVTFLFDWIAWQIGFILHPRPTHRVAETEGSG